ncbi:MAG: 4'-phosphopantetheinyl transferase family protein, partial [Acutalibacteraceae bacterium]
IEKPEITFEKYGKPVCRGAAFSVSHSSNLAVCAILTENPPKKVSGENGYIFEYTETEGGTEIGADAEEIDEQKEEKYRRIARVKFTKEENKAISELSGAGYAEAFLKLWTRKESYGKMTGRGIAELSADTTDGGFITKIKELFGKKYVVSVYVK